MQQRCLGRMRRGARRGRRHVWAIRLLAVVAFLASGEIASALQPPQVGGEVSRDQFDLRVLQVLGALGPPDTLAGVVRSFSQELWLLDSDIKARLLRPEDGKQEFKAEWISKVSRRFADLATDLLGRARSPSGVRKAVQKLRKPFVHAVVELAATLETTPHMGRLRGELDAMVLHQWQHPDRLAELCKIEPIIRDARDEIATTLGKLHTLQQHITAAADELAYAESVSPPGTFFPERHEQLFWYQHERSHHEDELARQHADLKLCLDLKTAGRRDLARESSSYRAERRRVLNSIALAIKPLRTRAEKNLRGTIGRISRLPLVPQSKASTRSATHR